MLGAVEIFSYLFHGYIIPVSQPSSIPRLSKWPSLPVDLGPYPKAVESKRLKHHDQNNN
jgi:hypothetical protein